MTTVVRSRDSAARPRERRARPDPAHRPEARRQYALLVGAIAALNDVGRQTPCQRDPGPFTTVPGRSAAAVEEREQAAEMCRAACPVVALCARYADTAHESADVWGGVDRSPEARRPATLAPTGTPAPTPTPTPAPSTHPTETTREVTP